mmetsp:Transcript_91234/g.262706  ORF Transcript_91234/g.262706 Transcript_91234/m.262706 type:complete len:378 (+) Transcript_91234:272-1405(+)
MGVAEGRDGGLPGEHGLRGRGHLRLAHSVDDLGEVRGGPVGAGQQELRAHVLHEGGVVVHLPEQVALEHGLGLGELILARARETSQGLRDSRAHLAGLVRLRDAVHAEEASVRIRRVESGAGLDIGALLHDLHGQPRSNAAAGGGVRNAGTAEDRLQQRHGREVLLAEGGGLKRDGRVAERRGSLHAQVAAGVHRLRILALLERDRVVVRERAHRPLGQLGVRDVDADQGHALRGEVIDQEATDGLGGEVRQAAFAGVGAEAEGVVAEGGLVQQLADHGIRISFQGALHVFHLLRCGLDLPREQTGEEHIPNEQRDDERHEFAGDIDFVDHLLAARLALRGQVAAELLEGLDSAKMAQVRRGVEAHHRHHVGDPEVG